MLYQNPMTFPSVNDKISINFILFKKKKHLKFSGNNLIILNTNI